MNNTVESADGKFVVIQDGKRVTSPTASREEAQQEADRRNKLQESGSKTGPQAEVKQNLYG